jgi:hypothetical protein
VKRTAAALLALFALSPLPFSPACAQSRPSAGPTEGGFQNPPDSAKPRAWWHWLSGNVTEPGITADLEWMKRVNIAGFQMFDGDLGSPLFVDKPLIWMDPGWKAAWHHAAAEADRLHLEMAMAASGGWSETAGPWVKPRQGMKKYVWSETEVEGPKAFAAVLPAPPRNLGKFQDMTAPPPLHFPMATDLPGARPQPPQPPSPSVEPYYADVAVVAYRTPEDEQRVADLHPAITSSAGAIDGETLMDGKYATAVTIPVSEGDRSGWVQFAFQQPFRTRAVTIGFAPAAAFGGGGLLKGEVQASDDGNSWRTLTTLPGPLEAASVPFPIRTLTFPETTAKYFRVVAEPVPANPMLASLGVAPPPRQIHFTEIEFASTPRVAYWEDKASFGLSAESVTDATPDAGAGTIRTGDVIDVTSKMRPDGTLDWQVPPGKWTILRLGYSLTGEVNHPATPAATGLEVDKLSRKDVQSYVEQYTKMISDVAGPYFGKSFQYFLMDSWEAGQENWTEDMMTEFRKRRGYDMTPYLPVLTGRVVGSAAASDAFLWDFRRTIADMLAENHYAVAAAYFKQHGIGLYAEAMGTDLPTTGDGLLNKGQVTIPMGEFWTPLPDQPDSPQHNADVREAASASHIYGKPLTATESFTTMPAVTPWGQSPFYLKPLADENFARGVNRIVFHTSDQQPFTDDAHKPGMTLGPFGQDYTRNITWAEQAKAWNTYLARCSYLLQQGRYAADVAYFYGEGAPATVPFWKPLSPALPAHYGTDFINADVLLHHASVNEGRLTLESGMSYKAIAIPQDMRALTLPVLRKLRDLVEGGVVLIAPKPEYSPSLSDGPDAAGEVKTIADQMWGGGDTAAGHIFGKGKVYSAGAIEDILQAEGMHPDFSYGALQNVGDDLPYTLPKGFSQDDLVYIHRHLPAEEIYFVATQKAHAFDVDASFRVAGKEPELWRPDTGKTQPAAYTVKDGVTTVPLHMDPEGSVFVVFREKRSASRLPRRATPARELATLAGPWRVAFAPNWGAPAEATFNELQPWTKNEDTGVKYFSGSAVYSKDVDIQPGWLHAGEPVLLDLGVVKEMAEVTVNGKPVGGVLWKPPFQVDIAPLLHSGSNHVAIKVTNLWPNRMIGDLQPGVTTRYTFTDFHAFRPDSPLLESGLLGPVRILN